MHRTRLSLDNPAFAGRLRSHDRSPAYVRRPIAYSSTSVIQDIRPAAHRRTASLVGRHAALLSTSVPSGKPLARKPQPHHAIKPAASMHARPKSAASARPSFQRNLAYAPVKKYKKRSKQTLLLYAMATMLFVAGLVVSLNGLKANRQVVAQVKQLQQSGTGDSDNSSAHPRVPSADKPSAQAVASYAVSPNLPRYIDIPKLNVHARVLSEGVDGRGALEVPWNIYDTGWYNASSQPGQAGAMLVAGHSGIGVQHGIFHDLNKLAKGDAIIITRGDGQKITYRVMSDKIVDVNKVDMNSMMVSVDTAKPGLSLITCTGDQIPGTMELTQRILVRAVM